MWIRLLGRPVIQSDDGTAQSTRGHQAWGVLARLLTDSRPISRRQLATELFSEADDPLGALRWCLAELRRGLGASTLVGDPLELGLPDTCRVDIREVEAEDFDPLSAGEFLEGIEPNASSGFATWLMIERERYRARLRDAARRRAISRLSAGDYAQAIDLANACIRFDPFDETGHILLIKGLTAAGMHAAAEAHVEATEAEFRAELGEAPSAALRSAARRTVASPPLGVSSTAIIESQIAAGKAALDAGAIEAGLDCFRRAAAAAEAANDNHLQASALLELGTALVHTTRGFDDEGAVVLRQSCEAALKSGSNLIAASALRELGYVDALAGRRPSASATLMEATALAGDDSDALAGIHAIIGFNLVDWGKPDVGLDHFGQAIGYARAIGNPRKEAWALGIGAWAHVQSGDRTVASDWLERCEVLCTAIHWHSFMPWVRAMVIESQLGKRNVALAKAEAERVFASSCQMGDPCWEAASARALALCAEAEGSDRAARDWMREAERRGNRVTDGWVGLNVANLSERARLSRKYGSTEEADRLTRQLVQVAARTHADLHLRQAIEWLK
jgi:DNA-binding SARP family transcriptional activator